MFPAHDAQHTESSSLLPPLSALLHKSEALEFNLWVNSSDVMEQCQISGQSHSESDLPSCHPSLPADVLPVQVWESCVVGCFCWLYTGLCYLLHIFSPPKVTPYHEALSLLNQSLTCSIQPSANCMNPSNTHTVEWFILVKWDCSFPVTQRCNLWRTGAVPCFFCQLLCSNSNQTLAFTSTSFCGSGL